MSKKILFPLILLIGGCETSSSSNQPNSGTAGSDSLSGGGGGAQRPEPTIGGEGGNLIDDSQTGGTGGGQMPFQGGEGGNPISNEPAGGIEIGGNGGAFIPDLNQGGEGGFLEVSAQGGEGGSIQPVQGGAGGDMAEDLTPTLMLEACMNSEASASICEVRLSEPGETNVRVENAYVTGVIHEDFDFDFGFYTMFTEFMEGFIVQIDQAGPGLFVETDIDALDPLPEFGQEVSFTVIETLGSSARDDDAPLEFRWIPFTHATQIEDWEVVAQQDDLSAIETPLEPYHPNFDGEGERALRALLEFTTLNKAISLDLGKTRDFGQAKGVNHFDIATSNAYVGDQGLYRECQKRFSQAPMYIPPTGLGSTEDKFIMLVHPNHFQIEDCDPPQIENVVTNKFVPSAQGAIIDFELSQLIALPGVDQSDFNIQLVGTNEFANVSEMRAELDEREFFTQVELVVQGIRSGENEIIANGEIESVHGALLGEEGNRLRFEYKEPDLVITEIFLNPVGSDAREFIEIYNPKSTPVRLSDYALVFFDQYIEMMDGSRSLVDEFQLFFPLAEDERELPAYSVAVVTPVANMDGAFGWDLPDNALRITKGDNPEDLIETHGVVLLVRRGQAPYPEQLPLLDSRTLGSILEIGVDYQVDFAGVEIEPGVFVQYVLPGPNIYHQYIPWDEKEQSHHFRSSKIDVSSTVLPDLVYLPWKRFEDAEPSPGTP